MAVVVFSAEPEQLNSKRFDYVFGVADAIGRERPTRRPKWRGNRDGERQRWVDEIAELPRRNPVHPIADDNHDRATGSARRAV